MVKAYFMLQIESRTKFSKAQMNQKYMNYLFACNQCLLPQVITHQVKEFVRFQANL